MTPEQAARVMVLADAFSGTQTSEFEGFMPAGAYDSARAAVAT